MKVDRFVIIRRIYRRWPSETREIRTTPPTPDTSTCANTLAAGCVCVHPLMIVKFYEDVKYFQVMVKDEGPHRYSVETLNPTLYRCLVYTVGNAFYQNGNPFVFRDERVR